MGQLLGLHGCAELWRVEGDGNQTGLCKSSAPFLGTEGTLSGRVGCGTRFTPHPIPGSQARTPCAETLVAAASIPRSLPTSPSLPCFTETLGLLWPPCSDPPGHRKHTGAEHSGIYHLDDSQVCLCLPFDLEHLEINILFLWPPSPEQITCLTASVCRMSI